MSSTLKQILFYLAIGALLSPFFINTNTYFPFIITKATVFRLIVEVMFVLWVIYLFKNKEKVYLSNLAKAVLIYGIILFISALLGINFSWSIFSGNERMEGVFGIWHFILFFLILTTTFSREELENILKIQVYLGLVYSLLAIYTYFGFGPINPQMSGNRLAGFTGNPSYFALYALFNAFFALYFYFEEYRLNKKLFNWWFLIFGTFSLLMFLTGCRGTMIGYGVAMLVIGLAIIFKKDKEILELKKVFIGLFTIGLIFLILVFSLKNTSFVKNNFALERLTSISIKDPTAVSRLYSAQTAFKAFLEKPLFGWGPENYQPPYIKYFNPIVIKYLPSDFFFDRAHNKPMEVLATTGIFGFISYLAIFVCIFLVLYKKQQKDSNWFLGSLALIGGIVSYFVQNIFIFDFHESYLMFFLVLSFIDSFSEKKTKEAIVQTKESPVDFSKDLLKSFVIIGCFCLVIFSLTFFVIKPYFVSLEIIKTLKGIRFNNPDLAYNSLKKIFQSPSFLKEDAIIASAKIITDYSDQLKKEDLAKIVDLLVKEADEILEKYPEKYLLLVHKGQLENLSATWDEKSSLKAEETFKKAVSLAPSFPQPRISYIKLLLENGETEKAETQIEEILKLNPDIPEINYFSYIILKSEGKKEEALNYLVKAIEGGIQISNINLITGLVKELIPLKRYDLIEKLYLQAINLEPKNVQIYVSLATTYGKMHNKEKAIEYANKALELYPNLKPQVEEFIQIIENEEWEKILD